MMFDPEKKRRTLVEFGLDFVLGKIPTSSEPIGNFAYHDLIDVVYGWLAGMEREFSPVLSRIPVWIDEALANREEERFGESPEFHLKTLYSTKALALWMLHGMNSGEVWDKARRACEGYWHDSKASLTRAGIALSLDDYMGYVIQVNGSNDVLEAGIEAYERFMGGRELSLSKVLRPREYGYALCLHAVRSKYSREDLLKAGRKMLRANLEDTWLGRGHSSTAAMWLKIVHWDPDQSLTPLEAIRMAYSDMPGVVEPAFI